MRKTTANILLAAALTFPGLSPAEPPREYRIEYDARYGSWSAESSRQLQYDAELDIYKVRSDSSVTLFGQTLTSISETANFQWRNGLPRPQQYSFVQTGIGARERSGYFDYDNDLIVFHVNGASGDLPLETPVYDELSAFQYLRKQLRGGARDIQFEALDKDKIETYHFRVLGEAVLHTDLGDFNSVRLERVRNGNSKRRTEMWLAKDHDYLLLKLEQEEPDGQVIQLEVSSAVLAGEPLRPLDETHLGEL